MDLKMMLAAAVVVLAGCGGASFSMETEPTNDVGGDAIAKDAKGGDDAETHVIATDADASMDASPDADPACACGDAGSSCFYSVDEPPSGYGPPYQVTTVMLTPSAPSVTFTASVSAVPQPYHNAAWYDLDVSVFIHGGTLYVSGQVGDGDAAVSSYLMAQCGEASAAGSFPSSLLESNGSVIDSPWTFPSYQFPAGTTVLHFGTEGSWGNPAGSTNTNKVTVLVQP